MIDFLPFTHHDFETLKGWIKTKEELFQFAGPLFNYPLTNDQLLNYINCDDKKPYKVVLIETKETIGHCELNYENGNHRLSRILIGKEEHRSKKLGELIVRKMANLLFLDQSVNCIDLNVFDWNVRAIKCYGKVGFKINPEKTDHLMVYGVSWTRLNMQLNRKDYFM